MKLRYSAYLAARITTGIAGIASLSSTALSNPTPFVETGTSLFANHDKCFYRLPSLLVTSKGTVLAACQKRLDSAGDFAPSSFVLRRSRDGGRTFEPERTLFDHNGDCTFNGNLVEDRATGTIFACFIAFPQAEHATWFTQKWAPQGGGFSIVKSTDDGRTWSGPLEVVPEPNADGWHGGGAFNNNHGIQLRHGSHVGRLVIAARVFKSGVYEGRAKGGLIYSDDHGATWHVGGVMFKGLGDLNGEVALAETAEGQVYVNSRNEVGKLVARAKKTGAPPSLSEGIIPHRRIFSRSRDSGETFRRGKVCHAELFETRNHACNAGLTWVENNGDSSRNVLLFTEPASQQRSKLTGYVSRDGGQTWIVGNIISENSGGYSDDGVLPDETILTLYENARDDSRPRGLLLARYNLDWLLGKKDPQQ